MLFFLIRLWKDIVQPYKEVMSGVCSLLNASIIDSCSSENSVMDRHDNVVCISLHFYTEKLPLATSIKRKICAGKLKVRSPLAERF